MSAQLFYNQFKSVISQIPHSSNRLIPAATERNRSKQHITKDKQSTVHTSMSQMKMKYWRTLLPKNIATQIYAAFLRKSGQ